MNLKESSRALVRRWQQEVALWHYKERLILKIKTQCYPQLDHKLVSMLIESEGVVDYDTQVLMLVNHLCLSSLQSGHWGNHLWPLPGIGEQRKLVLICTENKYYK